RRSCSTVHKRRMALSGPKEHQFDGPLYSSRTGSLQRLLEGLTMPSLDDRCTFCGNEGAAGVGIDDGRIFFHFDHRILSKSGAGGAHILVRRECLETDDIDDRIKKALERRDAQQLEGGAAAKSEEPRCVLCEGEDATGYRIDEKGIELAFVAEVEADCFLCK